MALISTLKDNFNDNSLSASWAEAEAGGATVTEQNQKQEIALPAAADATSIAYIISAATYDLTGSYAFIEVTEVPDEDTFADAELMLQADADNWFRWIYEAGYLYAQAVKAGVGSGIRIPYDSVNHRFWAIQEAGGVIYWKTSADGITWTTEAIFVHGMTITAMYAIIAAFCFQAETNPGNFKVDNFNLIPAEKMHENFNDNSFDTVKWVTASGGGGAIAEQNKRGEITYPAASTSSTLAYMISNDTFDLDESYVHLEVTQVPSGATNADAELRAYINASNYFRFIKEGTNLYVQAVKAGVPATGSTPYNATNHRWWRIREASGTIYWDVSADGVTWSTLANFVHGMTISAVYIVVIGSCFQNETNPGSFIFDNLNAGVLELRNSPIRLKNNHLYKLSFLARSTLEQTIGVKISNNSLTTDFLSSDAAIRANVTEGKAFEFTATANDDNCILRIIPERAYPSSLYIDRVKLIDLTVERKEYRIMRIVGSLLPGSFIQTLTLREKTANETA